MDGPVAIDPATIKLSVDGTEVTVLRSKTGNVTTTTYSTAKLNRPGSQHDVAFTYAEGGSPITVTWSFTVANYVGPNGNFYEFVSAPAIPWEDAKAAAEQRTLCGQPGHLATITSPDEDVYLQFLWEESVAGGAFAREAWTGGFQLPNQATPNDGWMWINGEGPIEGFTGGSTYAGWFFGEPNDCCQSLYFEDNEENYLGIGVFGVLGWNDDGNGHLDNIGGYIVEYERPPVTIDIKPGASPNVVYLDSNGKLPVAILSSPAFNAATVDPSSIRFGKTGTEAAPASYSLEDVNKDGRKDLLCHFNTQDTGLLCGDSTALLLASTYAGCPIRGSDSIQALRCAPYVLSVEAMQDVHHLTDIYLKVTTVLQGYTAPAAAQSVQLKSFDIFGHLRWTKAFQNVALTPNPGPNPTNFSSADLQFTDVEHYQRVKAQLGVRNSQNGNVQILRQEGVVLLRPDLTVDRVDVLGSAYAQQIVNISASIKELNGDLGGAATVYLMEGANVLDVARGVFVGPRGNVGVIFSAIFTQTGAHALTVVIGDETPGDYDLSNNDKSFTIDVLQQPAFHYANYHHSDFEFLEEQDNPYWTSRNYQKGASEELSEQLYIPVALNFPVEQLTIQISADGTLRNDIRLADIPADSSFTYDNCYTFSTVSLNLDDGFTLYIQSERSTCYGGNYQQSYASLYKQAYDYVFYSSYHDKYWGTTIEDSGAPKLGNLLSASLSLQIRFVLEDDGSAYGGTADLSLFSYPYDEAWDFEYPDWGYDRGYSRGTQSYGASSGFLTP
ncbi:MAG: hypothetical protein E6L09_14580 [Verrucomicrobia bacterium]|nr:MAG: hypothetical protein E6L09_14580 [Verrucomicrobiota bacterium]